MPAFWGYPPPHNDYPYHWVILDPKSKEDKVKVTNLKNSPKFQIFEFRYGHYTWHTFWNCSIRCANMKWIQWVLLKIQSGHDSVHRRTDGQTDKVIPVYPLSTSLKRGGITNPGEIWNEDETVSITKRHLKCCLQNVSQFVSPPQCDMLHSNPSSLLWLCCWQPLTALVIHSCAD